MSEDSRYALAHPEPEEKIMPTSVAQEKYQALRQQIVDARKKMQETAKGLFNEMSAGVFEENPTLMSFSWTQYTPYFNDGDVCEFSCHSDYPTVSMMVGDDLYSYDSNRGELLINDEEAKSADDLIRKFKDMGVDSFSVKGKQYAYNAATKTVTVDGVKVPSYTENSKLFDPLEKVVADFLRTFEDEDMEAMFGDHMKVIVSRDGSIETEEYSHD
jgi:hypothetical protein